jgi:hypothetical protein
MDVIDQLHALAASLQGKEPHRIGGWVGPGSFLDTVEKSKIPRAVVALVMIMIIMSF